MDIPLTQGRVAVVDDEDYPALSRFKWHYTTGGYAIRRTGHYPDGVVHYMHNEVMGVSDVRLVDHINRDKLDNRKCNLRVVDLDVQGFNRVMPKRDLPRGVYHNRGGYIATVRRKNVVHHFGWHKTVDAAHAAYQKGCLEIYGELPPE